MERFWWLRTGSVCSWSSRIGRRALGDFRRAKWMRTRIRCIVPSVKWFFFKSLNSIVWQENIIKIPGLRGNRFWLVPTYPARRLHRGRHQLSKFTAIHCAQRSGRYRIRSTHSQRDQVLRMVSAGLLAQPQNGHGLQGGAGHPSQFVFHDPTICESTETVAGR